jgi:hypothetical protein
MLSVLDILYMAGSRSSAFNIYIFSLPCLGVARASSNLEEIKVLINFKAFL